ncbi:MAG: adenosylhomocysteinase [Gemmatimonadaceae bacterium]|nr:adenosylhomocysteinase [Gemmatimonadaceae bacterium]
MKYDIKDLKLAPEGLERILWAERQMDVLRLVRERFSREKPLRGVRVGACLHITSETANLARTLKSGGAEVFLCASNPLSTQDDAAAAIVKYFKIPVFAVRGEDPKTYYKHIEAVLAGRPKITIDDGADLISFLHGTRKKQAKEIWGSAEETTTGVLRIRRMEHDGVLQFPVVAVNEARTKYLFDNRYGTGQSTIDGLIRATGFLLAGKTLVICGYGWCGRGVALRAKGMGADVIIVEVDALRALEAKIEGYEVMPIAEAALRGDIFITLTGDRSVIRGEHFRKMKDGAVIANAGHFDVELALPDLKKMAKKVRAVRKFIDEFTLRSGKKIYLLAKGRLLNLSAAEGHPASVMDMSFSNQALSVEFITKNWKKLENKVYAVPEKIDEAIAQMKLKTLGVTIDKLTPEQREYLSSWKMGT